MNYDEIIKQDADYIMPTYARFPVALVSGKGASVFDEAGKTYIDFGSGIGVNSLGYSNEGWAAAVSAQAAKLQHISNLYYSPVVTQLAEVLCKASGFSKVFFGNSGAEANECAIKLARKYSFDKYGEGRSTIVTLKNSFHGRTVTTLSATGQDAFHHYFFPFTEGFKYAPANDTEGFFEALDDSVCAVILEAVQGEGGVVPLEKDFVKAVSEMCKTKDILLIFDEIQTGIGRTGKLFGYQHFSVTPDIITLAKGLGGGLPIGACLCGEDLKNILSAGMHGTTFGGNPVACAGALYVMQQVLSEGFLEEVARKGELIKSRLSGLACVSEIRGLGMMLGIKLKSDDGKTAALNALKNGLIVLTAKTLIRLLPPLNISGEALSAGLDILENTLKSEGANQL